MTGRNLPSTPERTGPDPGSRPSRRVLLGRAACGFASVALSALMGATRLRAESALASATHFRASARRVIFLFMQGGPSQVDTFDYKPRLERDDGKRFAFDDARTIANTGKRGTEQRLLRSPWRFAPYGGCGRWVSELFPHMARSVDDLCFLHGLYTEGVAHGPATLFLHTGAASLVRPSLGAWVSYGLGAETGSLPAFVTLSPSLGNGGARNFSSAFLPAIHQGTPVGSADDPAGSARIPNLTGRGPAAERRRQLELVDAINTAQRARSGPDGELDAVIGSYELAWRMQSRAPAVLSIDDEPASTRDLYGIGAPPTDGFGRQCLIARKLCEAGVRFVQVTYGDNSANPRWDQHSDLPRHEQHARAVDKPIAGLLADLKRRGLLEDTLVWWGGEFGRTPYAEKNGTGRDHNPGGFTVWLAGGGVKAGFAHGATDELGHLAADGRVHMHDLHATVLHLLGLDHERLTYRHDGREFRLTDVHGQVVREILA